MWHLNIVDAEFVVHDKGIIYGVHINIYIQTLLPFNMSGLGLTRVGLSNTDLRQVE